MTREYIVKYEGPREDIFGGLLEVSKSKFIRCKDCKYWVPGTITDRDDFIPPKCGKYKQMVGHSADDYCSLAERAVNQNA